jgi:hypothetical protein
MYEFYDGGGQGGGLWPALGGLGAPGPRALAKGLRALQGKFEWAGTDLLGLADGKTPSLQSARGTQKTHDILLCFGSRAEGNGFNPLVGYFEAPTIVWVFPMLHRAAERGDYPRPAR